MAENDLLIKILESNGHSADEMVDTDEGPRTALQVLQSHIGHAFDQIEGTEDAQIGE